jgi:UTP:GlnB (protein PII) uridylyltransferase
MVNEIQNRHLNTENFAEGTYNLKETKGGLRDIEGISLMIKCFLKIPTPISITFLNSIKDKLPLISKELETISHALYFLRNIRNLYRITVAAEDDIQLNYFITVAEIYYFDELHKWDSTEFLLMQIAETLEASSQACKKIIDYLVEEVDNLAD